MHPSSPGFTGFSRWEQAPETESHVAVDVVCVFNVTEVMEVERRGMRKRLEKFCCMSPFSPTGKTPRQASPAINALTRTEDWEVSTCWNSAMTEQISIFRT